MDIASPTTTASDFGSPAATIGRIQKSAAPSRTPKRGSTSVANADVTPVPKKRKQLSADEFRERGKSLEKIYWALEALLHLAGEVASQGIV